MRQKSNGTHLILMELMLVLCFFAICGSILIQVFVRSHQISTQAREMTETKNYVTQAAELIEAGSYKVEEFKDYFSEMTGSNGHYQCYFDKNWNESEQKKAVYKMTIDLKIQSEKISGKIQMLKGKKEIYDLDIIKHRQGRK